MGRPVERRSHGWNLPDSETTYARDERGKLVEVVEKTTAATNTWRYGFDFAGNRVSAESNGVLVAASFAEDGRCIGYSGPDFEFATDYDLAGNKTATRTESGAWRFLHDGTGRPVIATNGHCRIEVEYGHLGFPERICAGSVTNDLYYANGKLAAVFTNGTLAATYVWPPERTESVVPLLFIDTSGPHAFVADWRKNPIALVSVETMQMRPFRFSPFGETIEAPDGQWIGWSSEIREPTTSLVMYRERTYNPAEGQWLSRDPLPWIVQDHSIDDGYGYLDGDPLSGFDHLGLLRFEGCSPERQNALQNAFDEMCNKITNDHDTQCSIRRVEPSSGPFIISSFRTKCDSNGSQMEKIGCADEDDCQSAMNSGADDCGFVCRSNSNPQCAGKTPNIPYLCPSSFQPGSGCGDSPSCTLFHEELHVILRTTSQQTEAMIRRLEDAFPGCR